MSEQLYWVKPSKLVPMRIIDCILDSAEEHADAYNFEVNYRMPDTAYDPVYMVFDGVFFLENVFRLYHDRVAYVDPEEPAISFYRMFDMWRYSRNREYAKMMHALFANYNPIENYDVTETLTNDITTHERDSADTRETTPFTSETTTVTHSKKTEETTPYTEDRYTTTHAKLTEETTPYTEDCTTTTHAKVTAETTPYTSETKTIGSNVNNTPTNSTTNSKKAFNSSSWSETDKSETNVNEKEILTKAGKEKIETSYDAPETVVNTKTGKEKTETSYDEPETSVLTKAGTETVETSHTGTDTDTRNYTKTISGNNGKQFYAEMIAAEFENLKENIAFTALEEFINRYTFFIDRGCE